MTGTNSRPNYLPTPEEIQAECEAIRSEWSEQTELSRSMRETAINAWWKDVPDPMPEFTNLHSQGRS